MSDPKRVAASPSESGKGKIEKGGGASASAKLPPDGAADVVPTAEPGSPKQLTAEEQMALYEKDLKENDWGHQPC